ncbi:MAG: PLP-dependent aminotransferase family protein [Eubacteriales bacterium]|nr:PLP-dependent aminotransferase family protein [Eubacteriales bacterium]
MALQFASRMDGLKGSAIRELLKIADKPDVISFAGGFPAPELFPVEGLEIVSKKVLEEDGRKALQYSSTEGFLPLREHISKLMEPQSLKADPDQILVTAGSQQGLDFCAKLFVNPGDVVITESPSYLGALNAFKAYEPKFVEVEMDEEGMLMDKLEEALKTNGNVKFIYTIPDFQNPTGRTMTIERRKKLVELANAYDVCVVEDNPYGSLRFEGEIHPAIKSFDTEDRVIYLGTMSKIFCPGMRIGWIYAAPAILNKFNLIKQGADLQCSTIAQRECAAFFDMYDINEHIKKIIDVYRRRRDVMVNAMKQYFPKNVSYTYPNGGLFLWVTLPEGMDSTDVFKKAMDKKVAFVAGEPFYPNGGNANHFRMNYSAMPDEKIIEGVKRLGEVLNELC